MLLKWLMLLTTLLLTFLLKLLLFLLLLLLLQHSKGVITLLLVDAPSHVLLLLGRHPRNSRWKRLSLQWLLYHCHVGWGKPPILAIAVSPPPRARLIRRSDDTCPGRKCKLRLGGLSRKSVFGLVGGLDVASAAGVAAGGPHVG